MIGMGRAREWAYRRKLLTPVELPAFVVSVGNISMGGTGKSAFALWLAEWALGRRIPTLLLSRGYKRKGRALRILGPDASLPDAVDIGDEPWMIKHRAPGIGLLVHADRARMAGRHWKALGAPRLVLLDDAFQHWRCARDLDVLMIDATEALDQGVLPFGRLRETVQAARRADLIVITRARAVTAEALASLENRLHRAAMPRSRPPWKRATVPEPWLVAADYECAGFLDRATGRGTEPPLGRDLLLVSGIAKPDHLRFVARRAGLRVVEELHFPDHHRLTAGDTHQVRRSLANLRDGALLITEKDWARWRDALAGLPGYVMQVRFEFLGEGAARLDAFLQEVAKGAGCFILP